MRRRYVQIGTELFEITDTVSVQAPVIIDDFKPWFDTSGKEIQGRRQWREHLHTIGAVELSKHDLEMAAERHMTRKTALLTKVEPGVHAQGAKPVERSQTACRLLERLEGRPKPDRKTIIQMAIEERMRK